MAGGAGLGRVSLAYSGCFGHRESQIPDMLVETLRMQLLI